MPKNLLALIIALLTFFAFLNPANAEERPQIPTGDPEDKLYVGKNSTEAIMTFDHYVEVSAQGIDLSKWNYSGTDVGLLAKKEKAMITIEESVEKQLDHIFGPMSHPQYGQRKSVPKTDHEIEVTGIQSLGFGEWKVHYKYEGTVVVELDKWGMVPGAGETLNILLPNNPSKIYAAGGWVSSKNPCTDKKYNSEGDFWYFWDPNKGGCQLKKGTTEAGGHYQEKAAYISRLPNTKKTYPEYHRLVQEYPEGHPLEAKTYGKVIKISMMFGMNHQDEIRDPYDAYRAYRRGNYDYVNAPNYVAVAKWLKDQGYSSSKADYSKEFGVEFDANIEPLHTLEKFEKVTRKGTVVVYLFYGPSGISESHAPIFHYMFFDALEDAGVMVYNGHSGLGGNLNMDYFDQIYDKVIPDKDNYQIYYFNSCSSYPYYNTMYFDRKKSETDPNGSKNLDIITNGLATYFSVIDDTSIYMLKMIHIWAMGGPAMTYQTFVDQADTDNLLGVNGDEDNPTNPADVQ